MPAMTCPVCQEVGATFADLSDPPGQRITCPRCGAFDLPTMSARSLPDALRSKANGAQILSHAIRKLYDRGGSFRLSKELVPDLLQNTPLPTPQVQLENLVLFFGDTTRPMNGLRPDISWVARLGSMDLRGLAMIIEAAGRDELIKPAHGDKLLQYPNMAPNPNPDFIDDLLLTFKGWGLYQELLRGRSDSQIAFLAMEFGNEQLNRIIDNHLRQAVADTGFDLLDLQSSQKAGLIDDRIRVEIRRSKFVLADLTHHNQGAYWEAGFAEGLGKPVIYLCRRDVLDDKDNTTHFDTNHHLTIAWDEGTIAEDIKRLKATIRATLPSEAKQED